MRRVLRVIEYTGPEEWLMETMARRGIKGTHIIERNKVIREAIVGEFSCGSALLPCEEIENGQSSESPA